MPLTFKSGDMFAEPVDALVNTVNCVGVMGKGVALEFKKRWPENFKAYKAACDQNALAPGKILTFDSQQLFEADGPRFLINFPTKAHWRSPSEIGFIESGLDALVDEIHSLGIRSVAMPPLGCGNGGLDWSVVRPIIEHKLGRLQDVDVIVFEPKASSDFPEFARTTNLAMTYPRSVLLKSLSELEVYFDGAFDRISLQKIVYFLQSLGVGFGLKFQRNLYGPYSDVLKKAFIAFEHHGLMSGFRSEDRSSHVTPMGYAVANEFLTANDGNSDEVVKRLSHLIEGFESPYGMELLSTVHWVAGHEGHRPFEKVLAEIQGWSDHKRNNFDEASIRAAYDRLIEDKLIH